MARVGGSCCLARLPRWPGQSPACSMTRPAPSAWAGAPASALGNISHSPQCSGAMPCSLDDTSDTTSRRMPELSVDNAKRPSDFDELHRRDREPWSFSARGAEMLRHEWIATVVRSLAPWRVVDVGCSFGE